MSKLAQFGRAKLGLEGDDERVVQAGIDDLGGRDWRDNTVYGILDRFAG